MGKYYPNVNPGEIVPGGFTYPNNAKLQGDFLYLRDANKNMVSGRQVDDGDSITVLDVGYSQQLALVQYPTSAGVRQGYVNNTPSVIKYNNANAWANGSTTEIVYDENGGQLGSLDPYEKATPLYKKDGMTHVVYNTSKGSNTKSGYVKYEGTGGGSTSPGGEIKPGELVPGGFTYPNNAKLQGDFLYLRDANKNMVSGRQVDDGDSITVLDVGYTKQLALVQYPTSAGVRQGYVNNTPSVIKYNDANAWANGSTTEIVYDENGGQLGSLSPYESATPLYKKNGMTHVVYNTDKGPNTKSGYVKYEGGSGFTDSNIQIPPISHPQAIKEEYGISGKGRPLNVYKIGNGSKVLFAGFALHGWEDNWDNDGLALVNIANSLITRLGDYKSQNNGLHGWTVYIAPCMNPDGVIVRGTKDGPGRCAVTSRIDMNRCFPYNFTPQYSSRNYTGANSLGAPEAKAIKGYLEKINSSSTEMIVLDFHGWMNFTQGNAEIGRYFGSQFGFGHNNGYSSGFFSSWASTLKNTKAVLIEYPTSTHSYSDVITGNYIGKTFNGIVNVLKNNSGSSSEWIQKGDSWYYYENGLMVTGWKSINGSWYYLESNGVMATGWKNINGSWYYLESSGAMVTGWNSIDGSWYYLESNGAMATGWLTLGDSKYYLNSSGQMINGNQVIEGTNYIFDGSGKLLSSSELIVVSGSETDVERYRYNFIEPAIKQIKELKAHYDSNEYVITWIISREEYSSKDVINFIKTATKVGVIIKFINSTKEFIDYINTQSIDGNGQRLLKIEQFILFGHGHIGEINLGTNYKVTNNNLPNLNSKSFQTNSYSHFYSCNTATDNEGKNSFAQDWCNLTKGKVKACVNKTTYAHITMDPFDLAQHGLVKVMRGETGYKQDGSYRYPVASKSDNAYWKEFV